MEVFIMSFLLFSSGSVGNPARPSSASVCHIIGITESLKKYFNVFGYFVLVHNTAAPPTPNTLHDCF